MIRTRAPIALFTVLAVVLLGLYIGRAGAQPALVTDYAAYPDVPGSPAGCDQAGLLGVQYTLIPKSGPPQSAASLSGLTGYDEGAHVLMSWSGVSPACADTDISLTIKDSISPTFNALEDQATADYVTAENVTGAGVIDLLVPDLATVSVFHSCNYQIDGIVGIPLAVVGPSGSFYSAASRGDTKRTMLHSFANGTLTTCIVEPPSTTTTEPPNTTTTEPTALTVPPPDSTTTTGPAPRVTPRGPMPVTGNEARPLLVVGGLLIAAGFWIIRRYRPTSQGRDA